MTTKVKPTVEKVGKEGKCPVCHIKCLVYKGVRSLEPGYYCHRCNRSFTPEGIFRPNYFWQTFNQKKVYVIPPPKRYSQEEVDKLVAHSVQEAKAEERKRTKKLIEAIHEEFKRDVLKLTNPALSLAAGIEIQINKYEKEIDLLSTLKEQHES